METTGKEIQTRQWSYVLRKRGVRLCRGGISDVRVVLATGRCSPSRHAVLGLSERDGKVDLKPVARREMPGTGPSPSAQEQAIQHVIGDQRPGQSRMDFARWRRIPVTHVIENVCDVKPTARCTGMYVANRGFAPQKLTKNACAQGPEAIGLFFPPSCDRRQSLRDSPETNPGGRFKEAFKPATGSEMRACTKAILLRTVTPQTSDAGKSREHLETLFQDQHVRYAA